MKSWMQRILGRDHDLQSQLAALRQAVRLKPNEVQLSNLVPYFAPASFFETGKWPGPYELLRVPGLGLTWSVAQPEQTMLYLNNETATHWEGAGIDWRQESMQNLAKRSDPGFATGTFNRVEADSSTFYALVFMHADGYGPSRLLFWEQLRQLFPDGYLVALPEMSCGLAISATAAPEERAKIQGVVAACYRDGTRPLVPGLHDPALLVPRRASADTA